MSALAQDPAALDRARARRPLRQVAADPDERETLERVAGTNEIPVLVGDDGSTHCGEDDIFAFLGRFKERADAEEHRAKAREEVPDFAEVKGA